MSVKAQENGQEARDGSSKDPNQDFTAITDRLHFLEKEYKQLSALFQYVVISTVCRKTHF